MKVISLFDGMSCGRIALTELGIPIEQYYASEIDKHAIKQTQLNFPDTIQLGDVVFLRKAMCWRAGVVDKFDRSPWISEKTKKRFHHLHSIRWDEIDLVLAGSPCQGFSFAGKQLAFDDPRSKLFFVFIDILNHIKKLNPDVLFLLENVNMKRSHMRIISEYCGVFPVNINSNLVSAQNRDRWYWTNIRTKQVGLFGEIYVDIPQPEDRKIFLRDILEEKVDEKYYVSQAVIDRMNKPHKCFTPKIDPDKTGCLTTKNNSGQMSFDSGTTFISIDGKAPTQRAGHGGSLAKRHNYQFIKLDIEGKISKNQDKSSCFTAGAHSGGYHSDMDLICVAMRGRNPDNPSDRSAGAYVEQRLEAKTDGKTNCLTSVLKDNLIRQRSRGNNKGGFFEDKTPTLSACAWEQNNLLCTKEVVQLNPSKVSGGIQPYQQDRIYDVNGISPTLCTGHAGMSPNVIVHNMMPRSSKNGNGGTGHLSRKDGKTYCLDTGQTNAVEYQSRIRRLTPTECSRLQTVPAWYRWGCSDTQIYKMLGNGWTIDVIVHLLSYMKENNNINVA